jgi:hypothetical protein
VTRWGSNPETIAAGAAVAAGIGAAVFAYSQGRINAALVRLAKRQAAREETEHQLELTRDARERDAHARSTRPVLRVDGRVIDGGRHGTTGDLIIDVEVANHGLVAATSVRVEAIGLDDHGFAVTSEAPLPAGGSGRFRFLIPPDSELLRDGQPIWESGVRLHAVDQPIEAEGWWPDQESGRHDLEILEGNEDA